MRILWFTNTSSSFESDIVTGGGWISSLENEIVKLENVDLGLVFFTKHSCNNIVKNKRTYYPIYNSKARVLIKSFFNKRSDKRDVEDYLTAISDFKPDIIHIHGTERNFGLINTIVKDIPILISIQGCPTAYLQKFFSGFSKSFLWQKTPLWQWGRKKSFIQYFHEFKNIATKEKLMLKNAEFVAGRTNWDKNVMRVLAPNARYFTINEMLRNSFYNSKWKYSHNKSIKIVSVIRDNPYKGIEVVHRAAIELAKLGCNFDWCIAGIENTSRTVTLSKKINEKIPTNVIFKGDMNEPELLKLLLSSTIFVQVSHIENSPNGLCEAMMLGMPIIASYVGGTQTMMSNDEGYLIQDGDAYSLAGKILELEADMESAIIKGNQAYNVAHVRHEKFKIVDELTSAYASIINQHIV